MKAIKLNNRFSDIDYVEFDNCHILTKNGKVIGICGLIYIAKHDGEKIAINGEHGIMDYVVDYGFKIGV
jgi:N-acetylglutamate synthase-like GNAT family acetyltransferase